MPPVIIGLVGLTLALNVITSLLVLLSQSYTQSQKLWQLLVVWVIPLVGAIAAVGVFIEDRRLSKPPRRDNFDPPENPPGTGMAGGP